MGHRWDTNRTQMGHRWDTDGTQMEACDVRMQWNAVDQGTLKMRGQRRQVGVASGAPASKGNGIAGDARGSPPESCPIQRQIVCS